MYTVSDTIHINAPVDRCFMLSTSIDLVKITLGMQPASGKRSGLVVEGDEILWHGWRFGFPQMHLSRITAYQRPTFFQDTMLKGRFRRFQHDHDFAEIGGHTLLHDKVRFSLPLGVLGDAVAKSVMVPHIAALVQRRFQLLKRVAESDEWKEYLPEPAQHEAQRDSA